MISNKMYSSPGRGGTRHFNNTFQSILSDQRKVELNSTLTYDQKRIWDGTSEREINKALSTFMNCTGPGDYQLPHLVGQLSVLSGKRNQPSWTLRKKSKPGYFPHYKTELSGQASPAATKYSPQ